jgi:hypothetical protein
VSSTLVNGMTDLRIDGRARTAQAIVIDCSGSIGCGAVHLEKNGAQSKLSSSSAATPLMLVKWAGTIRMRNRQRHGIDRERRW